MVGAVAIAVENCSRAANRNEIHNGHPHRDTHLSAAAADPRQLYFADLHTRIAIAIVNRRRRGSQARLASKSKGWRCGWPART